MATEGPLDLSGLDLGGGATGPSLEGEDESAMADEMESESKLIAARKVLKVLGMPASKAAELRDALSAFMGSEPEMED